MLKVKMSKNVTLDIYHHYIYVSGFQFACMPIYMMLTKDPDIKMGCNIT